MKGKRYADVEAIQKACTVISSAITGNELKHSLDILLNRVKSSCTVKAKGHYFEEN